MNFGISKRKNSGIILAGTFVLPSVFAYTQQSVVHAKLSTVLKDFIWNSNTAKNYLIEKSWVVAVVIVLFFLIYSCSGNKSNENFDPKPRELSLEETLEGYEVNFYQIDVEKVFDDKKKDILAEKCRNMFLELLEKFGHEKLRFEMTKETVKQFLAIDDNDLKQCKDLIELTPTRIDENNILYFKAGELDKEIPCKKPIYNAEFFNMLSISASQWDYSIRKDEKLYRENNINKKDNFSIQQTVKSKPILYIVEEKEGLQQIDSADTFNEVTNKIQNILDEREEICKALDNYKVCFSDVTKWAFSKISGKKRQIDKQTFDFNIDRALFCLNGEIITMNKEDALFLLEDVGGDLEDNTTTVDLKIVEIHKDHRVKFQIVGKNKEYWSKKPIVNAPFINLLIIAGLKKHREQNNSNFRSAFLLCTRGENFGKLIPVSETKVFNRIAKGIEKLRKKSAESSKKIVKVVEKVGEKSVNESHVG